MNVSIFLRQFGSIDSAAIVQWIQEADSSRLGAERLRALLRILPEPHEVQLLTPYIDAARTRQLAAAERFYVQLIALPKYADTFCCTQLNIDRRCNVVVVVVVVIVVQ